MHKMQTSMAFTLRKPKGVSKMQKQKLELAKPKTEEEIVKQKLREFQNPAIPILKELIGAKNVNNKRH